MGCIAFTLRVFGLYPCPCDQPRYRFVALAPFSPSLKLVVQNLFGTKLEPVCLGEKQRIGHKSGIGSEPGLEILKWKMGMPGDSLRGYGIIHITLTIEYTEKQTDFLWCQK